MGRIEFAVGEAFPADDPVARWVATLTTIGNDVARVNRQFDLYSRYGPPDQIHHTYWVLLQTGHLREALKFLSPEKCDLTATPEVEEFLAAMPRGIQEELEHIRSESTPWEGSWLNEIAKPSRDRFFHYASSADFDREIEASLDVLKDEPSHVDFPEEARSWAAFFGEQVRLNWIAQGGGITPTDFHELIGKCRLLAERISRLTVDLTKIYLERYAGVVGGA